MLNLKVCDIDCLVIEHIQANKTAGGPWVYRAHSETNMNLPGHTETIPLKKSKLFLKQKRLNRRKGTLEETKMYGPGISSA